MELVTGAPLAVTNAELRMAAVSLLSKAHELSNVRAQPYDLKTSFTASHMFLTFEFITAAHECTG